MRLSFRILLLYIFASIQSLPPHLHGYNIWHGTLQHQQDGHSRTTADHNNDYDPDINGTRGSSLGDAAGYNRLLHSCQNHGVVSTPATVKTFGNTMAKIPSDRTGFGRDRDSRC